LPGDVRICSKYIECPVGSWCGSLLDRSKEFGDVNATDIYRDSADEYLNYGITNFDNIFSAFLVIFQIITMEGWTQIMYIYMDAYEPAMVKFYFISCVIVCSFFLLNLTIAVMLMEYEQLDKSDTNSSHSHQLRYMGD
jgi:hypothetical protein